MGAAQKIEALLPSLWRPAEGEGGLLGDLIAAAGAALDSARIAAGDAMQSHWLDFADSALLSSYMSLSRRERGAPPLLPKDPDAALFPYVHDLARLANLLGLVPFTEPADGKETVEQFRARIRETVALWQEGLATRAAIVGTARLALSGLPFRAVSIEELTPGEPALQPIAAAGAPADVVGPLMRWRMSSGTLASAPFEIRIEGVAAVEGKIDATRDPLVERFDPATGTGVAIGYEGLVDAGQVLMLRPTHTSWLGTAGGLASATSLPAGDSPADPTAAGPWSPVAASPAGLVRALAATADGSLWAAVAADAGGALWRHGADGWAAAFTGLPEPFCLMAEEDALFLGHAAGVSRLSVFDAAPTLAPDPAAAARSAVHALVRDASGSLWAATEAGAAQVGARGGLGAVGPGARAATATPLRAVCAEADGILWFGGAAGLFRYESARDRWHFYGGESADETVPDWHPWSPAADPLPPDSAVFLPAVTALLRGPDQSLWIGTEKGLARYRARGRRGTYATRLEAFPELGTSAVNALAVDERQRLWAATDRGLLLFDGAQWFQAKDGKLERLPAFPPHDPDVAWRFDRAGGQWQTLTAGSPRPPVAANVQPIASAEAAVTALFWTDGVAAELDGAPAPGRVRGRLKPDPTRIVDMAIPCIPRLRPGGDDFRYLALEEAAPPKPTQFPAWTREGRLRPPPGSATAPFEGRYLAPHAAAPPESVFAFNPAAKLGFRFAPRGPLSITVRIEKLGPDDRLPPVVTDRVRAAIEMVRPAGARVRLVHGETPVNGGQNG